MATLADMTMDQASDAAIKISSALSFALEDKEVKKLIGDIAESGKGTEIVDWIPAFLPRIVETLFRRQKNALYEIVGALCQKETDAVGKMSFGEVVQVVKENWSVLIGFFTL